jgi:antitoxin component YwqK of YwqJK toxin-antitoxin module
VKNFWGFPTFLVFSLSFLSGLLLNAQNKIIKNYYDAEKTQIKEVYKVMDRDSTILDGMYKTYYQNGKIKTIGFYTKGQATDYWEYFYQNGNVKMEGIIHNFFNQGHWIFYYETGIKSMEGNMDRGKKNGFWRFYTEDGKIKSEGMIVDGLNDGEWKYFYEEGLVKAKGNYADGIGSYTEYYPDGKKKMEGRIKLGKSDSTWNYYHPNGNLKATGLETNGLKEGPWQFFYANVKIASEGNYSKGETIDEWKYYYEDGMLSSKGRERGGQKEGEWKMFYSNGILKGTGSFDDGNGPYVEYYENGNTKIKGEFKKGKYEGKWEFFYEDGTKEGECLYNNGEGWYTGYYSDKAKKMEGFLKDGNKSGVWKLYKKDGAIAGYYKTYYEDNEPKPEKPIENPGNTSNTNKYIPKKKTYQTPKFFPKIRLYKPDPNIYKTFILSIDPIQLFLNSVPISLEYYVQERWGLEASFAYLKSPIFTNFDNLPLQKVYQTGQAYSIKYKKYFANPDFIGRPYVGAEYRYKSVLNSENDTTINVINVTHEVITNNHELVLIVGDRFMKHYEKGGLTFDVYFGLGIGYTRAVRNYAQNNDIDAIFGDILKNKFYPPFRFGVSLGYAF